MKPGSRSQEALRAQLKAALAAQKIAVKNFREMIREIPSGLPHPDGRNRILKTSRELAKAQSAVVNVLVKLNKISLNGNGKK